MRLTVLGSGTAVPVPDRFPAGYLVERGASKVLVDCGPGSLRRLAQAGVSPAELDAVLLTHYHTDHCADLAALLFALRSPHLRARPPLTRTLWSMNERFIQCGTSYEKRVARRAASSPGGAATPAALAAPAGGGAAAAPSAAVSAAGCMKSGTVCSGGCARSG